MPASLGLVAEASNSLSAKQCLEKMAGEGVGPGKVLKTSLKRSRGFPEVTWLLKRVQSVSSDPNSGGAGSLTANPLCHVAGYANLGHKSSHLQIGV